MPIAGPIQSPFDDTVVTKPSPSAPSGSSMGTPLQGDPGETPVAGGIEGVQFQKCEDEPRS